MKATILSVHRLPQLLLIALSAISLLTFHPFTSKHSSSSSSLLVSAQDDFEDDYCDYCDPDTEDDCYYDCGYADEEDGDYCDYCNPDEDDYCYYDCGYADEENGEGFDVEGFANPVQVSSFSPFMGGTDFMGADYWTRSNYPYKQRYTRKAYPKQHYGKNRFNNINYGNQAVLSDQTAPTMGRRPGVGSSRGGRVRTASASASALPYDDYGMYDSGRYWRHNDNVQTIVRLRNAPTAARTGTPRTGGRTPTTGGRSQTDSRGSVGTMGFDDFYSQPDWFNLNYGNQAALLDGPFSSPPRNGGDGMYDDWMNFPPFDNINYGNQAVLFDEQQQQRRGGQMRPMRRRQTTRSGSGVAAAQNVEVQTTQHENQNNPTQQTAAQQQPLGVNTANVNANAPPQGNK